MFFIVKNNIKCKKQNQTSQTQNQSTQLHDWPQSEQSSGQEI